MRPFINIINNGDKTPLEEFQNAVLRPLLKLHSDEFVRILREYIMEYELQFGQLKDADKRFWIFEKLKRNVKLFSSLNELILKDLNSTEKLFYLKHKKELNKRLKEMLGQRLGSNLSKLTLTQNKP